MSRTHLYLLLRLEFRWWPQGELAALLDRLEMDATLVSERGQFRRRQSHQSERTGQSRPRSNHAGLRHFRSVRHQARARHCKNHAFLQRPLQFERQLFCLPTAGIPHDIRLHDRLEHVQLSRMGYARAEDRTADQG